MRPDRQEHFTLRLETSIEAVGARSSPPHAGQIHACPGTPVRSGRTYPQSEVALPGRERVLTGVGLR